MRFWKSKSEVSPPKITVSLQSGPDETKLFTFTQPFRIGRRHDCEVCIQEDCVSRIHAEVVFEDGEWRLRDLKSANGIYVDGELTPSLSITDNATVSLGNGGPKLTFSLEKPRSRTAASPGADTKITEYINRYFEPAKKDADFGAHTMFVRQAFERVQTKQKKKYGMIIAALAVLVSGVGAYAFYEHRQTQRQRKLAEDLFYNMKMLDVDIARLELLVAESQSQRGKDEILTFRTRREEMQQNYDQFLNSLHVYNTKLSEQDRLILRVARIFGECEMNMPPGFVPEVHKYIEKWKSSGRLTNAVSTAVKNGYNVGISQEMLKLDLPPQFFYLALQESNFDPYIVGPQTRKGIAKGIWQFIPETAVKYGLKVGPLADLRRPDPGDDRHRVDLATKAAARYLKDLYSTDAQASGLLVMASYNWGENQVLPLIRSMPPNPKDRNFWRLLTRFRDKIPQETYDYVFFIVSAAVIGESPPLFGFDFDNPLGHLEQPRTSQKAPDRNGIVSGVAEQKHKVYSGSRVEGALAARDSAFTSEYCKEVRGPVPRPRAFFVSRKFLQDG
jgi:membrane-bound lytic murein transglycosylase D